MRELIRADERRKAENALEAALLEGLDSAEAPMDPADWGAIGATAVARGGQV